MVPTLTILGVVSEWIWLFGRDSAVTRSLLPVIVEPGARGADTACRTLLNCPFVAVPGASCVPASGPAEPCAATGPSLHGVSGVEILAHGGGVPPLGPVELLTQAQ